MVSARLKVSKSEALYRDYPKGFKWCRKCTMFRTPNKCTKVAGTVRDIGYCRFYFAKGASHA
jgi:hypothetical protein